MAEKLGIFQGKQSKLNKLVLQTLYDNGPLSIWEITGKSTTTNKVSLHAILNKRVRDLQKKGYVGKNGSKVVLEFKGILANLLLQEKPKPWSDKWSAVAFAVREKFETKQNAIDKEFKRLGKDSIKVGCIGLRDFNAWVGLSEIVKSWIEQGVINFDVISNPTLINFVGSQITDNPFEDLL